MAEAEPELGAQAFNQDFSGKSLVNRTLLKISQRRPIQVLNGCGSTQSTSFVQAKWACDPSFLIKAIIFPSLPDITEQSLSHVQ